MEVWIDCWLFMSLVRGLRADGLTLSKLHSDGEKGQGAQIARFTLRQGTPRSQAPHNNSCACSSQVGPETG